MQGPTKQAAHSNGFIGDSKFGCQTVVSKLIEKLTQVA